MLHYKTCLSTLNPPPPTSPVVKWFPSACKFGERASGVNLTGNLGGGRRHCLWSKFESLIHIIDHDETSDTVEDNVY